ncbi:membrane-associated guanylate kinase, WW and PDZ domain-containing protein 2-like isoform X2 [Diprion similis]|uniref:membrane-associated guanylate kinase, WW and PDZ domain-containing protein 2-like isoform X2 n=1 Tax=Diprion similis TaxID=362088 RepID=UPI001EF7B2A8|nr:membrane-associated guanylate kinase, WW and PDZ domain-containing protein 2-like isoform X2 [Diprion similis]
MPGRKHEMAAQSNTALSNDGFDCGSCSDKEVQKIGNANGSIHLVPPSYLYNTGSGQTTRDLDQEHSNQDRASEDELGPLPSNWEKAYTDTGEVYFIDHNSGTSHWLDPRLSKFQKRSLEECLDDELPYGWEKIDDTLYGTYFIDHVNRRTQYENPVLQAKRAQQGVTECQSPVFTRNPEKLKGLRIRSTLLKGTRGLGFTIVGGDDAIEEFLQIKSVVPNGPAWIDGKLQTGDVLVYVNETCVLGYTHNEMVNVFKSISSGETVTIEVCRGYPLPFDPNDPNTEVVTTIAVNAPDVPIEDPTLYMDINSGIHSNDRFNYVDENLLPVHKISNGENLANTSVNSMPDLCISDKVTTIKRPNSTDILLGERGNDDDEDEHTVGRDVQQENDEGDEEVGEDESRSYKERQQPPVTPAKPEFLSILIVKGTMGFGFTIADSAHGQKVKKILDRQRCKNLMEGDILVDINVTNVRNMCHSEVVQVLKDCPRNKEALIHVQRTHRIKDKKERNAAESFRSKTPTADLYSTLSKTTLPSRPKTPLVDTRTTRHRPKTPTTASAEVDNLGWSAETRVDSNSINGHRYRYADLTEPVNYTDALYRGNITMHLPETFAALAKLDDEPGRNSDKSCWDAGKEDSQNDKGGSRSDVYSVDIPRLDGSPHKQNGGRIVEYNYEEPYLGQSHRQYTEQQFDYHPYGVGQEQNVDTGEIWEKRKETTSFEHEQPHSGPLARYHQQYGNELLCPVTPGIEWVEMLVTLVRQNTGFGFRIVGGTEEGSQVSVGHIVPGGAADLDNRLITGDLIMSVDGESVMNSSHHHVVQLMIAAAQNGRVTLGIRRRINIQETLHMSYDRHQNVQYPYDITVSRMENEGFGFVIISSLNKAGSTIGRIIEGSPAERCGQLNVGDHILAVNHVDITNVCHKDIVNLIKDSGYSVTLTIGYPLDDCCSTMSLSQKDETAGDGDGGQYHAVELTRGTRGFGFSIRGGREFQNMPLFVLQIAENGPASVDSRLRVGDQIIEINSINTKNMTHTEAIEIIRNGGPSVRLLVKRGCQMPSVVGAPPHLYDMNI